MGAVEVESQVVSQSELILRRATSDAESALVALGALDPTVGAALSRLVQVVAAEATRTPRFAKALAEVFTSDQGASSALPTPRSVTSKKPKRSRALLDPFQVFEVSGEVGLRARLKTLSVEQLKDVVAQHAMNYDKAAMRWKSDTRLTDRIVERVQARVSKGDVLR